jgi:hypothetical protein
LSQQHYVVCTNPSCVKLNRVAPYTLSQRPTCGACKVPLPETGVVATMRYVRGRRVVPASLLLLFFCAIAFSSFNYHQTKSEVSNTVTTSSEWQSKRDKSNFSKNTTDDPAIAVQPRKPQAKHGIELQSSVRENTQQQSKESCQFQSPPKHGPFQPELKFGNDEATLTLRSLKGANYFVVLVDPRLGMHEAQYFVEGGKTLEVQVAPGQYKIKYAAGQIWCGPEALFGNETVFSAADKIFVFENTREKITHWTVELIARPGGNLRTTPITRDMFFGAK